MTQSHMDRCAPVPPTATFAAARRTSPRLAPLLLALTLVTGPATAVEIIVIGKTGIPGLPGAYPGGAGSPGGPGEAVAFSVAASPDNINSMLLLGGDGGAGGNGADSLTLPGGAAGAGGRAEPPAHG